MGHIGFSSRRGATGDAAHRPSDATHPKSQGAPPKAALPQPLASLRAHIAPHRAPSQGPREPGQSDSIKPGKTLNSRQRLIQIVGEVLDVFEPRRQANQAVGDTDTGAFLRAHRAVSAARRVGDQAFGVAQIIRYID